MTTRATTQCDECGSPFFKDSSTMMGLCPECAHVVYGYPPCVHAFDDVGVCTLCGWDQSRSTYIEKVLEERANSR